MRKDKKYCSDACCKTASAVAWAAANREKYRANQARYSATHPDIRAANKHRRRAREKLAPGRWTAKDAVVLRSILGTACLAQGDHGGPMSWDHVVPLARGGSNRPTNLQPLCRSHNSRKSCFFSTDYRTEDQVRELAAAFGDAG